MKTIAPVAYEDLRRLFKSRNFKERLTKAALDTRQYREENQFNIARDFRGKNYFGDVVHKTDVADDPDVSAHGNFLDGLRHTLAAAHLDYRKPDVFPLLVFHTHTHSCPAPSDGDLRDMENLRSSCAKGGSHYRYDIMPLYAIASWQQDTLEFLVLQEKKKIPMEKEGASFAFDYLDTQIQREGAYDCDTVASICNMTSELRALSLPFRMGRDGLATDEKNLRHLRSFAYRIKVYERDSKTGLFA